MKTIRIRIKATGRVIEYVPSVARAMVAGGTAEYVDGGMESAMLAPAPERAVAPDQNPPKRKKGK